jgi:LysR family transcriptional activator of nhaA
MTSLNYKHLRYFWMVAKTGSIARAAAQLHLTPHAISGQLSEFATSLGVQLFRRAGRNLELTEAGRRIARHAEQIFTAGDELLELVRGSQLASPLPFRVGCADSVSKLIACRLVEPALRLPDPVRLVCREGRLDNLLADLAVHRLDLVIADRPIPAHFSVRAYNHLLGQSPMTAFATAAMAAGLAEAGFPACLDDAPVLFPGEDFAIRARLFQWLEHEDIHVRVIGEFDDSAMMKTFGQSGAGVFFAPAVIAAQVCEQYQVVALGTVDTVVEQVYAITTERRMSHPATVAIGALAREKLFV